MVVVNVMLAEACRFRLDEVIPLLRALGLTELRYRPILNIVSGLCDRETMAALRVLNEVLAVEEDWVTSVH